MSNPQFTPALDGAVLGTTATTQLLVGDPVSGCLCLRNHNSSGVALLWKIGAIPTGVVQPTTGVGYLEPGESMNFGNINLTTFIGIKAGGGQVLVSAISVPAPDGGGGGSN